MFPQKIHAAELERMHLNNFRNDLSTVLMAHIFEGFNDLCPEVIDIEVQLNKPKKSIKDGGSSWHSMIATIVPKKEPIMPLGILLEQGYLE